MTTGNQTQRGRADWVAVALPSGDPVRQTRQCPALGSGMNRGVLALTVSGGDLYAGGFFTAAGGRVSAFVAKANLGMVPVIIPVITSIGLNPSGTQALLTFTCDPGAVLHLLSSTNLTTWQTNSTVYAIGVTNSVWISATQPYEFFRLRRLP